MLRPRDCGNDMIIYRDERTCIQFYKSSTQTRKLFYTFTPFQFRNLEGNGFGIPFLTDSGFDVICFKSSDDNWYQHIDESILGLVDRYAQGYMEIFSYGSSMGGFGAILFANRLKIDKVIAISPQFSISDEFDRRWSKQAAMIDWRQVIDKDVVCSSKFYILYDNYLEPDRLQIERLKYVVPSAKLTEIRVPFSGHPSGHFLADIKHLKKIINLITSGENGLDVKWAIPLSKSTKSTKFLINLARYAVKSGRISLAILCRQRVARMFPNNTRDLNELEKILNKI